MPRKQPNTREVRSLLYVVESRLTSAAMRDAVASDDSTFTPSDFEDWKVIVAQIGQAYRAAIKVRDSKR